MSVDCVVSVMKQTNVVFEFEISFATIDIGRFYCSDFPNSCVELDVFIYTTSVEYVARTASASQPTLTILFKYTSYC